MTTVVLIVGAIVIVVIGAIGLLAWAIWPRDQQTLAELKKKTWRQE